MSAPRPARQQPQLPPPSAASSTSTTEWGRELEERVARLLRREGWWRVRTNVEVLDRHGNRSELDVTYGLFRRRVVECKHYSRKKSVPLEDVAKFKEVLQLNGMAPSRGTFVTTSVYSPRARHIGIKCIDGDELRSWERRALVKMLCRRSALLTVAALGVVLWQDQPAREEARKAASSAAAVAAELAASARRRVEAFARGLPRP